MKEEFQGNVEFTYLRRITYDTSSEPDKVLDFYKSILEKDGWTPHYVSDKTANELYYAWENERVHEFTVKVQKPSANVTSVELLIRAYTRP